MLKDFKEIRKYKEYLNDLGIRKIKLFCFPIQYWRELVSAFKLINEDYPLIFNYLDEISYKYLKDVTMKISPKISYEEYVKSSYRIASLHFNYKEIDNKNFENMRYKNYENGFHKTYSFKSYIMHEMGHLLEISIKYKSLKKEKLAKMEYDDFLLAIREYDIPKQAYIEEFGDLDRSNLIDKYAYGNKNVSEFCAEAFSEYYCLENPPMYAIQVVSQYKKLYKKYF